MRYILFTLLLAIAFLSKGQSANRDIRTLIVIFDGLRPDYITPALMPNLYSLKQRGAYVSQNHSVFPTVTRVNASSYATGSYPSTHGLMGNTVYFPEVDRKNTLNTGDAGALMRIAEATGNQLLTAKSLGEILKDAGERLFVFSSGSSGQAFLQNHTVSGGAVIHPDLMLPSSIKSKVLAAVGPPPAQAVPNFAQHDWVARAFLHFGLQENGPRVSAIWFSDPDGSAHKYGIGSAQAMESIKGVDEHFGFIIRTLENRNLIDKFNIIVTADHGFATNIGKVRLRDFLIEKGLKQSANSDDVILAGNAIFVKDHDRDAIAKIVATLQPESWVGAIFTRPAGKGSHKGWVPGTLSFDVIHWDHKRSGDILVDYNWTDEANELGYKGSSFSVGVAGHGGASSFEINIPLVAFGPSFKRSYESKLPTSNIDIVPTILEIYQLPVPSSMQGRVLHELLNGGKTTGTRTARTETLEASTRISGGTYRVVVQRTIVGKQRYVDFARVERVSHD